MTDILTASRRSWNMSRIRGTDTKPEFAVRRYLHRKGLRYRLRSSKLPGKPDLVFLKQRVCVFVHGCFWHGCTMCADGKREVKSNQEYWSPKIAANKERDARHKAQLQELGWTVLSIWECEVANQNRLEALFRDLTGVAPQPVDPNRSLDDF